MSVTRLLIANRGEIAVRVARAAAELGIATVAVHSADDASARHVTRADAARALPAEGPPAYLDRDALVAAAVDAGCDAVHPGYGFLSEDARFARAVLEAGLVWVGPRPELLERFGDKAAGRALARACGVPVLAGTDGPTTLEQAQELLASLPHGSGVMVKALGGGGGRGLRPVTDAASLDEAWRRCRSEAEAAFGKPDVYVERLVAAARHLEVQVVGDGSGAVLHLGERDCSLQRRHQKLMEIAPAPGLSPFVRERLLAAAVRMAEEVRFDNVGTFEFLVELSESDEPPLWFIEANPRLQVEHTVTEEVSGVDLVRTQLLLARGATLASLGLTPEHRAAPRGTAVQARVLLERVGADGSVVPSSGRLEVFEPPSGPGVRVDTAASTGDATSVRYDSLLAKVVAHHAHGPADALARLGRALGELRVEGVETNAALLAGLAAHPLVATGHIDTRFVESHTAALLQAGRSRLPQAEAVPAAGPGAGTVGAVVDAVDPLAVLDFGKAPAAGTARGARAIGRPGDVAAPLQGTVVSIEVGEGDVVGAGTVLLVLEAMKMEHEVRAPAAGRVWRLDVRPGQVVAEGQVLLAVDPAEAAGDGVAVADEVDLDRERADLAEVVERHAVGLDERRPEAVARRHGTGHRTARENVEDLVDPGSLVEYGPLVVAAQRRRRSLDDLIANTPADGLVGGLATVNAGLVGADRARCIVASYDYMVLAGTQGNQNHRKKDRLFELAERHHLPVVLFAEGGGGRPGDTDGLGVAGLDCLAFHLFGRLSGKVPLVGITTGRCFAGNAALLGSCDVIIATEDANIGMGGPAMIEGGGLGVFRPEDVGPVDDMVPNGVIDVVVADEAEAVAVAKQYLSYLQGPVAGWSCADQRVLRHLVPENRLRVYDVRAVLQALFDEGSVLELRRGFGVGMVTALARVEGRPCAVLANDPTHLGGAIDAAAAEKATAFLRRCDAHGVPVVYLCDTPGFMVGPDAEREGLVRRAGELFGVGANLRVPYVTVVLRKGYGLGAQAMAGGSFKAPMFTVAWPTGEFGGMGLEGAVKLGYRKELAAIDDPQERRRAFEEMVDRMYEHGKAVSMASHFEIDDVIDPADTRRWITAAFGAARG